MELITSTSINQLSTQPQILQQSGQQINNDSDDLKLKVMTKLEALIKYSFQSQWNNSYPESTSYAFALLSKSLHDLQTHFTIILGLLNAKTEEEVAIIMKKSESISKMYVKITQASMISLLPLNDALDTVVKLTFEELKEISNNFKSQRNAARMQISAYKLATITEYLPAVVQITIEGIFNQPRTAEVWKKLYQNTEYKEFKDKNAVLTSIKKFSFKMTLGNTILYKSYKTKSEFWGTVLGLSYAVNHSKVQMMSSLYLSNPSMDTAFKLWNIYDQKLVKELYKLKLPKLPYDKKIYVPRLFSEITRECVLKEYEDGSLETIREKKGLLLHVADLSEHKESVLKNLFNKDKERVKIRILSSKPLIIRGQRREKVDKKVYEFKQKFKSHHCHLNHKQKREKLDGVIIHIHGGGFVSMSSSMHRNYLNLWAKDLNVVIFSIDYRLAPEHPYPAAIDDTWQAYNWLINYSESVLGIPMHNIVLTGDSAGGNLAASLTLKAIREGVRIPDGLLLSYPALNLFPLKFVPSYFQAMNDVILPANLLKLCLKAYIPEEFRPQSDSFLSPVVASDELLEKLPPVRMITGTCDPLHDDVWTFEERLVKLGKDVKVTIFEGLPHGFLSLDEMLEYDVVVSTAADKLAELLMKKEGNKENNTDL